VSINGATPNGPKAEHLKVFCLEPFTLKMPKVQSGSNKVVERLTNDPDMKE